MTKTAETQQKTVNAKTFRGTVTSDAMDKTVVVEVDRFIKHPKYSKFYTKSKKLKAHDEANEYKVGDLVMIEECRPISKDKRFKVISKIK